MQSKIRIALLGFTIYLLFGSCSNLVNSQGATQVELSNGTTYDFSAIGEAVKHKKIVAIGESSHGVGDFYAFKSELVKYLHKHHGFEVLAFEAGLGDLNLAYGGLDTLSADELLNQTLFPNFRCEEIEPLFDYIKTAHQSDRPLIYTGFDNQWSSSFFRKTIQPIIAQYDPVLAVGLKESLYGYIRWFQAGRAQDSLKYRMEADAFVKMAISMQSIFTENKSEIQSNYMLRNLDFDFIDQTCKGFIRTVELPFTERHRISGNRDEIMFDNFEWLVNKIYPDKKVIIWAHNGHIEQAPDYEYSFKWMGHFLHETYGENYYALGLFAHSGTAYQQWGDTIITLNNTDASMMESRMMETGHHTSFLDVSQVNTLNTSYPWIAESIKAFENENGGIVSFIPKKRFDGVVVMREVKAPKY